MSSSAALLTTLVVLSTVLPLHVLARGGFSIELIHRDSPKSPYYNSSANHFDRIRAASHRSISRAAWVGFLQASSLSSVGFQSQLIPSLGEYLMTLTLGSPAVERVFIADTGSDITWTQCTPCTRCFKQDAPLFNPDMSSTYKKISCPSPTCQSIRNAGCSTSDNSCLFINRYNDNAHSIGTLSTETFSFNSTTGTAPGSITIPELIFGCSTDTAGFFNSNSSGIVGLGGGPGSLITQLSSTIDGKFSYCMVPFTNSSASSVLSFGDKAVVTDDGAVSTPLVSGEPSTFYYVTLEEITIGSDSKEIAVKSAGSSAETGNVIVDSSTPLTFLDEDVVTSLEMQLLNTVQIPQARALLDPFRLCFDTRGLTTDPDLPDITFKYTGGSVKLSWSNTFVWIKSGTICLAIVPNRMSGISIIGSLAQQNFHVEYDLQAKTVTFAPKDCASL